MTRPQADDRRDRLKRRQELALFPARQRADFSWGGLSIRVFVPKAFIDPYAMKGDGLSTAQRGGGRLVLRRWVRFAAPPLREARYERELGARWSPRPCTYPVIRRTLSRLS